MPHDPTVAHGANGRPVGDAPVTARWTKRRYSRPVESLWSLRSTNSILSIASDGSILSIGSAGSIASIVSVGSICSLFSIGSTASAVSALSFASMRSLLASRSVDGIRGRAMRRGEQRMLALALIGAGVLVLARSTRPGPS